MILKKYLDKIESDSYKEFKAGFKIKIPENFNFAYDVVDEIAVANPSKIAMVWCDAVSYTHLTLPTIYSV